MKYIHPFFTCFFVILINDASFGQGYIPVVSENAEWTVLKLTIDTQAPPFPRDTSYVRTWIAGDTTIADMDFKKVFSREFLPGDNIPRYQGAIREENQIVTWIPSGQNISRLDTLYNFNLTIGDTVAYYSVMSPFYHYVHSIDTIVLEDGVPRKRMNIYTRGEYSDPGIGNLINTWVEGLGELEHGLVYPFCETFNHRCLDGLICFKKEDGIIYEYFPLACSINPSNNEPTVPFIKENAKWSVAQLRNTFPDPADPGNIKTDTVTYYYTIQGDTSINNISYQKVYSSTDSSFNRGISYHSALRENDGLVYNILRGNFFEDTLYNFNLAVGDTLFQGGVEFQTDAVIILNKIDTIILLNGENRRRYWFNATIYATDEPPHTYFVYHWIEGIGNLRCPFESPLCIFSSDPAKFQELLCYYLDEEILYKSAYPDCFVNTVITDTDNPIRKEKIEIYPNPAHEQLYLYFDSEKIPSEIIISDITGKIILKKTYSNKYFSKVIKLNVSSFAKGIYIVHFKYSNFFQSDFFIKI